MWRQGNREDIIPEQDKDKSSQRNSSWGGQKSVVQTRRSQDNDVAKYNIQDTRCFMKKGKLERGWFMSFSLFKGKNRHAVLETLA